MPKRIDAMVYLGDLQAERDLKYGGFSGKRKKGKVNSTGAEIQRMGLALDVSVFPA